MLMKKINLLALVIITAFVLTGCGDGDEVDKLEDRIEQLEHRVTEMETNITEKSEDTADLDADSDDDMEADSGNSEKSPTPTTAADTIAPDSMETLTKAVEEVTAKMDTAVPPSDIDKKRAQFFNLKDEMDAVSHRLDAYDDDMESQYKQNSLSYEDYRGRERLLKELEDTLDKSEDKLERTFKMDD